MEFVPASLPSGSITSQSPSQKSNWRCSGAEQSAGGGGGAGADCARRRAPPEATSITSASAIRRSGRATGHLLAKRRALSTISTVQKTRYHDPACPMLASCDPDQQFRVSGIIGG